MEPIFQIEKQRAEAQARQYGSACTSGIDAFNVSSGNAARRSINDNIFLDGDVIEVPKLPQDDPNTADQWIAAPLSRGGDPVTCVLVKCTAKSGKVSVKRLFAGTITKSVMEHGTDTVYSTGGSVVTSTAVQNAATVGEIFAALASHKIRFGQPKTVKVNRRDFNGVRPDRISSSTVFQNIEWAD